MVEVVPGVYNAHFNDLDKPDSIDKINQTLTRKITMVVNRYRPCPILPYFTRPSPYLHLPYWASPLNCRPCSMIVAQFLIDIPTNPTPK